MDERVSRMAALANIAAYDPAGTREYVDAAPHVKHASLRRLYGSIVVRVFDEVKKPGQAPRVLDLGAGEGSVTRSFLELGARVVATDISASQLDSLKIKCARFGSMLEVRCEDMNDTLRTETDQYDIVVVNSFLHHIPDYLAMLRQVIPLIAPNGKFFSFQDPLRYDSVGKPTLLFSTMAYFSWRALKGDLIGGLRRRLRRSRGVYLEDSVHDNAEYHVTRNGVDQEAIAELFRSQEFQCEVISYFSTQSRLFQPIGEALKLHNTFAVVATRTTGLPSSG